MKLILLILVVSIVHLGYSQLSVTAPATPFVITFDATVAGVNNGSANGSGFATAPAAGQLDADAWATSGLSDGAKAFTVVNTGGDHARGNTTGGVTTGGLYAFSVSGDVGYGWQPGGSDATPGSLTLHIVNNTGATVTSIDVSYNLIEFNDQGRSNSLNFSHDGTGTNASSGLTNLVGALDYTTTEVAAGTPAWVTTARSTSITGLSLANGASYYLRWATDDVAGSGSRDELGIDDVSVTMNTGAPANTITTTGVTGNPWTVDCNTNDVGTVTFTSTGTFNAPNIYTAQLSDAAGGFSSPINIGTLASTANSGTINITIPIGQAAGAGYRIRVVSDDPIVTGTDNGSNLTINNTGGAAGNMIVNEMSNGASGSKEYMEFLVVGAPCTNVNIQNLIFDDNNGDWGTSGRASGHFRLTNHVQWGCVQNGTLIVVYNSGDKNASLPADDQTDSNGDNIYIIPDTSIYVERCTTDPNAGSAPYNVGGCVYASGPAVTWSPLGLANGGDVAQTRDVAGTFFHGIGYSSPTTTPAGGVSLATTGGGNAFIFDNSIDNDYTNSGNFSGGAVGTFESPGAQNTAANGAYISSMICTILPVEWLYFELEQSKDNVNLQWATASETMASHYEIERSTDAINYETIGQVQAINSSNTSIYNWIDHSPMEGLSYYRIKQLDENLEFEYTSVKSAYFYGDHFEIENAYQSEDELFISFNTGLESIIDYQLFDIDGRLVIKGSSASNQLVLHLSQLSTGMYILNASNGFKTSSKKIFIK